MAYVVSFDDDTTALVDRADAYEQEGPLTTFFERNGGGRLASAFSERIASFRTNRIVEVRRLEPDGGRDVPSGGECRQSMSASSTTTSHRCAHAPQR